jgi:hypothetical protein
METVRFDSRVVRDLRVTGAFDNNGKQTSIRRCYATFKKDEQTYVAPGTLAAGHRFSFAPLRIYDYRTQKPFAPPPTASIRAVTLVGKTTADHALLQQLATKVGTGVPATHTGYAVGVMRSPIAASGADQTDTVASIVGSAGPAAPVRLNNNGRTSNMLDVAPSSVSTDHCNPYVNFYQYLSPIKNPGEAFANSHVGVCYEYADTVLAGGNATGGASGGLRLEWNAPKAAAGTEVNSAPNAVAAANPGLSLFITPFGRAAGQANGNHAIGAPAQATDIAIDVIVELEYDKNTAGYDAFVSSNDDLAAQVD